MCVTSRNFDKHRRVRDRNYRLAVLIRDVLTLYAANEITL